MMLPPGDQEYVDYTTKPSIISPTYAISDELTEWDEILIKKGIKTREQCLLDKGIVDPSRYLNKDKKEVEVEQPSESDLLDQATLGELDELEEDLYDDSRALEEFRAKRIAEMKAAALSNRFGTYDEISKSDYIRDVTERSQTCWVVIHLYQDSELGCNLMDEALLQLAPKFKQVCRCPVYSIIRTLNGSVFVYEQWVVQLQGDP